MTIRTSTVRTAEFILSEASGDRSRENVKVTQTGVALLPGTVLTRTAAGAAAAAATAGNTGNPTFGAITTSAGVQPGAYKLTFTAATKFTVEDPAGVTVGSGTTGSVFAKGGLSFTLTAGGTAAVAGDEWTISVAPATGTYSAHSAGTSADGVLYAGLTARSGVSGAVALVRDCEVIRSRLVGLDDAAETQLADAGVIVRGTV